MIGRGIRRLPRRLGRRGAILSGYGLVWVLYGYGQLIAPQPDRRGLELLLDLLPLHVWAWAWITAGTAALVSAWLPQGVDVPGFVALVVIVLPWMLAYFASWWPLQTFPRGWIAAVIWGAITIPALVAAGWPEPPRPKELP